MVVSDDGSGGLEERPALSQSTCVGDGSHLLETQTKREENTRKNKQTPESFLGY